MGTRGDSSFGGDAQPFPLSQAQLGMWFAKHVDPSVPANIAQYVELGANSTSPDSSGSARAAGETGSATCVSSRSTPNRGSWSTTTLDDTPEYVDLRSEPDPRAASAGVDARRL
ncbi:hypothetical protein GS584_10220, partial [Rhodococcus hoagii]|nr:hypothetical protein [Prescottella equi]